MKLSREAQAAYEEGRRAGIASRPSAEETLEADALAVAALREALRTAERYGDGHVTVTVALAQYLAGRFS